MHSPQQHMITKAHRQRLAHFLLSAWLLLLPTAATSLQTAAGAAVPITQGQASGRFVVTKMDVQAIHNQLGNPWVLQPLGLARAPYIIQGANNKQVLGVKDYIYVRGQFAAKHGKYSIMRRNETYLDPVTNELLGLEMRAIGQATLISIAHDDTGILQIISANQKIHSGDQLVPSSPSLHGAAADFTSPTQPSEQIAGQVISLRAITGNSGKHSIAVINQGIREGVEPGNILAVYQPASDQRLPDAAKNVSQLATPSGFIMVFLVFEKMSYGIASDTQPALKIGDVLRTPKNIDEWSTAVVKEPS